MTNPTRQASGLRALALAVATTALAAGSTVAMADPSDHLNTNPPSYQPVDNPGHPGWGQDYGSTPHAWRSGDRIGYNDWSSAQPIDYRAHHLRSPPQGYAWRESNGQFVLAAIATGAIASVILDSGR